MAGFEESYAAARSVLAAAKAEAFAKYSADKSRRWKVVGVTAVAWIALAAALTFVVNRDFLLVGEIGLIAIVVLGVFYLIPSVMGKGELEELFSQYEAQLNHLEELGIDMPPCQCIEELVAAIDYVSPSE